MTHEAVAQAAEFTAPPAGIGFFEKWLSVWVALCIVAGLALGHLLPGAFETLAAWEYASVTLVVAVLIWAMEIGRASCRERVCQYGLIPGVAVSLKTKPI